MNEEMGHGEGKTLGHPLPQHQVTQWQLIHTTQVIPTPFSRPREEERGIGLAPGPSCSSLDRLSAGRGSAARRWPLG